MSRGLGDVYKRQIGEVIKINNSNNPDYEYRVVVPAVKPKAQVSTEYTTRRNNLERELELNLSSQKELVHKIEIDSSIEYDRLDASEQMSILDMGLTKEQYNELSADEKMNVLHCFA